MPRSGRRTGRDAPPRGRHGFPALPRRSPLALPDAAPSCPPRGPLALPAPAHARPQRRLHASSDAVSARPGATSSRPAVPGEAPGRRSRPRGTHREGRTTPEGEHLPAATMLRPDRASASTVPFAGRCLRRDRPPPEATARRASPSVRDEPAARHRPDGHHRGRGTDATSGRTVATAVVTTATVAPAATDRPTRDASEARRGGSTASRRRGTTTGIRAARARRARRPGRPAPEATIRTPARRTRRPRSRPRAREQDARRPAPPARAGADEPTGGAGRSRCGRAPTDRAPHARDLSEARAGVGGGGKGRRASRVRALPPNSGPALDPSSGAFPSIAPPTTPPVGGRGASGAVARGRRRGRPPGDPRDPSCASATPPPPPRSSARARATPSRTHAGRVPGRARTPEAPRRDRAERSRRAGRDRAARASAHRDPRRLFGCATAFR